MNSENKEEFIYFNDEWNKKECVCINKQPNSFTGNCLSCNLIINPIKNNKPDGRRYKK